MRSHVLTLIILALLVTATAATNAVAGPVLQVHLPRAVQVEGDVLTLGAVAVVRSGSEALAGAASAIPMGRAPLAKEEIVLDRLTILGRLQASGISGSEVLVSGAEKVVVSRREITWPADDLVKAAEACLAKDRPSPAGSAWRVVRPPQDIIAPAGREAHLEAKLVPQDVTGEAKVEVAVTVDGRREAAQPVLFRLSYVQREAVAAVDISAGGLITSENVTIRTLLADAPPPADWAPPFGLVAAQPIRQGAVIRPTQAQPVAAGVAVRRGETVVMRLRGPGFLLTGLGQALEDGRPGGFIKVRNVDSSRVITAKVAADGSVEPVFDGVK
jgi:flagella basal body P-ring formation protein FlgA